MLTLQGESQADHQETASDLFWGCFIFYKHEVIHNRATHFCLYPIDRIYKTYIINQLTC